MVIRTRRLEQPTEEWRTFPEIAPYEVSDLGRVRSPARYIRYRGTDKLAFLKERILKQQPMWKGHLQVTLWFGDRKKTFMVHRLVLTAFVGPSDLGTRHINDNPADNRLSNLAWGTQQENMNDRVYAKGPDNPLSKTTAAQDAEIRSLVHGGHSQRSVAQMFGISHTTVQAILRRE